MNNWIIDGEVIVDGKISYCGINPDISSSGLRLWRREENQPTQIRAYGPHFNLSLPTPLLLQQIPRGALLNSVKYVFAGPYLGSVDENAGLASLHEGAKTRCIDLIELEVNYRDKVLSLSMSGTARQVDPPQSGNAKSRLEPISFHIDCPIPITLIRSVFPGREGWFLEKKLECETIQQYLEAIKFGPPKDIV